MAEFTEIEVYKPPDLNSRLKDEHEILEQYFWPEKYPILHTENNEPYFEHDVKLKGDRNYKLRVYVNSKYPDKLPNLVVCESPEPMPVDSPEWGGRHATHTWPPLYGFLRICHWHWVAWTRENMIYQVFNKGEEWLEAYEKYLVTKKLPLELKQMELTAEEKVIAQRIEQRQLVQLQQHAAFAMCQLNPNWHMHAIIGEILSQRPLPIIFPITADEIRNAQRLFLESAIERVNEDPNGIMFAELFRLQCAITECRLANPGCNNINVSCTQTNDGRIHVSVTPAGRRSLENS